MYNLYRSPTGLSGNLKKRVIDSNERMKEIAKRNAERRNFTPGIKKEEVFDESPDEERIPSDEDALFADRDLSSLDADDGTSGMYGEQYDEEKEGFNDETSGFVPGLNAEELSSPDSLHDSLGEEGYDDLSDMPADSADDAYYGEETLDDAQPIKTEENSLSDEEIMESVRERAMQYIEEVREQAKRESDNFYQEAYNKALNDARQTFEAEKAEALGEIDAQRQSLENEYATRFDSMESELVPVILSVLDDVLDVGFKDNSDIIFFLIKKAVLSMESPKQIAIKVSKDNFEPIKESVEEIKELVGADVSIDVLREESFTDHDCKIETEYGIFDCGLDTEFNNLKKKILMLSKI